ncbi:MAG: carbohydrate kinase family protein [Gemmatimonadetes bacterium]|nr:carbohydrate kinase family protein [Gemmatimonadota bacterium]
MKQRLGILGTFVWDRIWTLEDQAAGRPFESWGGLAYSLAAAAAVRPDGWEIVALARVGADLADEARAYTAALQGVDAESGLLAVPEANNRVELRYTDDARRGERLTGGVEAWSWEELGPRVAGLDALYVNYFSGFEIGLEVTERLRAEFGGPMYTDLHSLFLGCPGAGTRQMRSLPDWERWVACFDAVQLNDDELRMLAPGAGSPAQAAGALIGAGAGAVAVTHGAGGASLVRRDAMPADPHEWPSRRAQPASASTAARYASQPAAGDPTGCGDVWGATFFTSLLAGRGWDDAIAAAHAAAVRKMGIRGATDLFAHLTAGR